MMIELFGDLGSSSDFEDKTAAGAVDNETWEKRAIHPPFSGHSVRARAGRYDPKPRDLFGTDCHDGRLFTQSVFGFRGSKH